MSKRRFKDIQTGEIFTLNDIRIIGGVDSNGDLMNDEDLEHYIHTLIRENFIVEI